MVYIKKLEIFGFKSFGFKKTTINFKPGLTAIAGANGSGKSNILDAIIFALGEKKAGIMRARSLQKLISDLSSRGPRMARAAVTFDNTDRSMAVDADVVDIAREMDANGESTYYLNKKQVTRKQIIDTLDASGAVMDQLNAVQQGTVTKIAELGSEDRRRILEDVIGLSSYDQKIGEAKENLDKADRKLDVFKARSGEIRGTILGLEADRNQALRHDMIRREIRTLESIHAINKINSINNKLEDAEKRARAIRQGTASHAEKLDGIQSRMDLLKHEKKGLQNAAEESENAKREIQKKISHMLQKRDSVQSEIRIGESQVKSIDVSVPASEATIRDKTLQARLIRAEMGEKRLVQTQVEDGVRRTKNDAAAVDGERDMLLDKEKKIRVQKSMADEAIRDATRKLNDAKLDVDRMRNAKADNQKKIQSTLAKRQEFERQGAELDRVIPYLESKKLGNDRTLSRLNGELASYGKTEAGLRTAISSSREILDNVSVEASKYEGKIRVIKSVMHEDYSIARLREDGHKLGVVGLAYKLVSWDKKYERAMLAAGSEWLKAFVVQDMATLLGLAAVAREKKLPKIKIIPLNEIPAASRRAGLEGAVGMLSDFVRCDGRHSGLAMFMFGNVVLAESEDAARRIAGLGHRAVTEDGMLFEARSGGAIIDTNTKLSRFTKIIKMSSSVEDLAKTISLFKKYIRKKNARLKKTQEAASAARDRKMLSEKRRAGMEHHIAQCKNDREFILDVTRELDERLAKYRAADAQVGARMAALEPTVDELDGRITKLEGMDLAPEQDRIASLLEGLDGKKRMLEERLNGRRDLLHRLTQEHDGLMARSDALADAIQGERDRMDAGARQRSALASRIEQQRPQLESYNRSLTGLRDEEQRLIGSPGSSSKMARLDAELDTLSAAAEGHRGAISDNNTRLALLERDIREYGQRTKELEGRVVPGTRAETFDTESLMAGLEAELRGMGGINAKAPGEYAERAERYAGMSERLNIIENERNTILEFIRKTETDKKQTFLTAFDRTDKEIRSIFSETTGGSAWLEIEDEDDIFSSGISYMVQFAKKPKRDSASISGGEKSIAAVVFVLALQRLRPSPFYLFDEVDAALDAANTKKIAGILERRSKTSQFLMVSLNDTMIRGADTIYGVHPHNGESRVVSYRDKHMKTQPVST